MYSPVQAAVEREDFDEAKSLKQDIDKLRSAGESAALGGDPTPRRATDPDEIFSRVLNKVPSTGRPQPPPPYVEEQNTFHDETSATAHNAPTSTSTARERPYSLHAVGDFDEQPVGGSAPANESDDVPDAPRGPSYAGVSQEQEYQANLDAPLSDIDSPQPPHGASLLLLFLVQNQV